MLNFCFALHPPTAEAREFLATHAPQWADEIAQMVDDHHKLRPASGPWPLVEVFRQGDLVDFSLGLLRFGLPASFVRDVKARIPNAGFHPRIMQLTLRQLRRDPLHLLPMMKW